MLSKAAPNVPLIPDSFSRDASQGSGVGSEVHLVGVMVHVPGISVMYHMKGGWQLLFVAVTTTVAICIDCTWTCPSQLAVWKQIVISA